MSKVHVVIAESRGGKLRQVALEAVQAARLASGEGDRVAAVLIGAGVGALTGELSGAGVDAVHVIDSPELELYNPEAYGAALNALLDRLQPETVIFGHTAIGRDLAPVAAAHLQAGQISDVTAIEQSGGDVLFTRPVYAGKAFEQKKRTGGALVVTIRPNNIAPAAAGGASGAAAEVVAETYDAPASLRTVVKDVVRKMSGKVDLTEAKIVVSGGRGVKSADGFQPLEQLAEVLNAAVGASRGACDAGYCDYALQIGQTGKVVTPEIYIACGISGAIQHLAGMSQSRIIIAINKDAEAPIFKVADYGIVGDLFDVVPLLTEEFKKALA
ncbi:MULTISPECIES: electron transfer flavoprotein subunit alpha/FixB family protein [Paenibacillus]|uniref:electron transfer flavoprotein subunit alpha/FixB family protein n=1 Tax=Paenibacillus TaxID=44249 RepID=UPI0022B85CE6|nr:electron transfer flavoprotein subunit alpha/FixB family protein [Paenibacillus caseinilyticus]MCZ8518604.1 electron transfer flavoprotein subunit alpha/FixB family protein [Paenibacillus caseinilyticus]